MFEDPARWCHGRGIRERARAPHPTGATEPPHYWVRGTREAPGPHPGILLAWEQPDGQWFALVSYYLEADGVLAQKWLAAELLTRVGG